MYSVSMTILCISKVCVWGGGWWGGGVKFHTQSGTVCGWGLGDLRVMLTGEAHARTHMIIALRVLLWWSERIKRLEKGHYLRFLTQHSDLNKVCCIRTFSHIFNPFQHTWSEIRKKMSSNNTTK